MNPARTKEFGEQITADIIELVLLRTQERGGDTFDIEPILRGIACALTAFAYQFKAPNDARAVLLKLAEDLDDPDKLEWARTNEPVRPH